MDHSASHGERGEFFFSRWNIGLLVFLAVAGFYLVTHRAHLFGALPFLLVLACPLMHFFMHGGHGHGGHDGGASGTDRQPGAHQH